ncbi:SDR family NAD(P)-dependent oxidoreductase [Streptomyces sp. CA-181903]|uniref:SDR family NAD(P)-dependent oxidoreductase n=1 Tax=Streptomyces sp. CA-181903 TaxID=3240055 RepID=UPI003D8AAD56
MDDAVNHAAVLRAVATASQRLPAAVSCTLWLVARPSGALPGGSGALSLADASTWGTARTLANENPRLRVRRLALERSPDPVADARRLVGELLAPGADDEVLLAADGRFVPRVLPGRHIVPQPPDTADRAYRLRLTDPGSAYRLSWIRSSVPEPGHGQVLIEVRAVALNYADVMAATGMMPVGATLDSAGESALGMDCAGVIAAVGADVEGFAPGDRVVALASGAFASHVAVDAGAVAAMPPGMSFTGAATLPIVFGTVTHALGTLARLGPGESVLIHAGAGGVGLAALRYARSCGAEVLATAGSPAKRDLLRSLGVEHVLDSRSLDFADQVMRLTRGRGVDVVLNSLAGEAATRSMELLRPYGRFVELGKRDIHANRRMLLRPFRANLSYFAVDIHAMALQRDSAARLTGRLNEQLRTGQCRPLPYLAHSAHQVDEAFRSLHRSQHIGKIVVSLEEQPAVVPAPTPFVPDPRATYLITGGLSGLGATTARWLARRGARHLTLVSRRGPAAPEADKLVDELRQEGAEAVVHAADATHEDAVAEVLTDIDRRGRRLGGVIHAAMVLDDAPLTALDDDRFRAVLAPKAQAGLLLDRLTRGRDLDIFVVYSSLSALVGHLGQSAYVGGNLLLEALVRERRRDGLPALAVAWPALTDTGYVARNDLVATMERLGMGTLTSDQAMITLDHLLAHGCDVAVLVDDFGFHGPVRDFPTMVTPRMAALVSGDAKADGPHGTELRDILAEPDTAKAARLAETLLTGLVAEVLQTTPDRINRNSPLDHMGLDSLMGTELTAAIRRRLRCDLPLLEVVNSRSIADLAQRVVRRVKPDTR